MKTSPLATLLLLALTGPALADPVTFTTLGRGGSGPDGPARQLVFVEEHQLVQDLLAQQLDPDPDEQIDWTTHQVIAVLRGSVESLDQDPETSELVVTYSEDASGPAPFHLVLCPRTGPVRFRQSTTPAAELTVQGEVLVQGDEVRLQGPGATYLVEPAPRARELARFPRRVVRVVGRPRGTWRGTVLDVSEVVSPRRRTITGVSRVEQGSPLLVLADAPRPVRVSGPAQAAVHAAEDYGVECDAFVFTDEGGRPVEASVESVRGAAVRESSLRSSASLVAPKVGDLRAGEPVAVLRTFGILALVRNAEGDEGWMHTARLRIGQPLADGAVATPGLVGVVGGLGD